MPDIIYEKVKKTNKECLITYEMAFFKAFSSNDPDGWTMKHYEIIDDNRLKSRILSLEDQEFYIAKNSENNNIVLGAAINFNKTNLQYEQMGFKIEQHESENFAEGLIFFSIADEISKFDFGSLAAEFFNFVEKDLLKRNIEIVYGTCSRKLKAMYSLLGYEKIDKIKTDSGIKLLMKMKNSNDRYSNQVNK